MVRNFNIDRQLRRAVIEPFQKAHPQLAKYLSEACWSWQAAEQCLVITLGEPRVHEQIQQSNSLLLRHFQKALPQYPILKLRFLGPDESLPPASASEIRPKFIPEVPEEVQKTTPGEHHPQKTVKTPKPGTASAGKQPRGSRLEGLQESRQISSQETITDYTLLPPDVQVLQKIFLAQVKQVQYKPESDENKLSHSSSVERTQNE